jgi:sterol desaturase/sphingolipid hydroxylase (fatty acid hydroxylase superfamily)
MEIPFAPSTLRMFAGFGGLLLFLSVENFFPFRKRVNPILQHYSVNLLIAVGNAALISIILGGFAFSYTEFLSKHGIGLLNIFPTSGSWNIILTLLFYDFMTCLWHIAYHRLPVLWRLHRVHHTDRDLDVTSASRFHLGEILVSTLFQIGLMTLLGPEWVSFLIFQGTLLAAAQFQHSNFRIPEPIDSIIRRVFVTPDMHRIHHSDIPEETNSNYATIFSVWDRLLRTYREAPQERIVIGLREYGDPKDIGLKELLMMPFKPGCDKVAKISG